MFKGEFLLNPCSCEENGLSFELYIDLIFF